MLACLKTLGTQNNFPDYIDLLENEDLNDHERKYQADITSGWKKSFIDLISWSGKQKR
jgi:hypothetical protein